MNKSITTGIDLGDKFYIAVVFDGRGNELESSKVINTRNDISLKQYFHGKTPGNIKGDGRDLLVEKKG